jgi:hypothetical protein
MPSSVGPNTKGEENLVFGYDLGDVKNSYKGEPTTNIATGTLTPYTPYNTMTRNGQDLTFTMVGGSALYLTFHNGVDYNGQIITLSGYMFKNGVPHSLPGTKANTYHTIPASKFYFNNTTGYFEIVENCNVSSIWLFHVPSGAAGGDIITIKNFQVEVKSHATPFVNGTRSATQALIDLKSTSTIDLTNVSFDTNAQMTFDGMDDWLNAPVTLNAGNFTYETVMQANSTDYKILTAGTGNPAAGGTRVQSIVNSSGALVNLYDPVGVSGWQYGSYSNLSGYIAVANAIRHIVVVNTANNWKTYVNGVLVGNSNLSVPTVGNAVGIARTGMQVLNPVATTVYAVKIYNRPLTVEEVRQNYQQYKTRFNLS